MQVTVSAAVAAMYVTVSSSNFIFLSLTDTHYSQNWPENIRGQKASNLHLTTLVNILPKVRYFVGRIYIKVGYNIHSALLFSQ